MTSTGNVVDRSASITMNGDITVSGDVVVLAKVVRDIDIVSIIATTLNASSTASVIVNSSVLTRRV